MTTPPCSSCGYPVRRRGDTCRRCRRDNRWINAAGWLMLAVLWLLIAEPFWRP